MSTDAQKEIHCEIQTELGSIKLLLYPEKAPKTVANFLNYVRNNSYDGSSFFRVCTPENEAEREIKIQVIDIGCRFFLNWVAKSSPAFNKIVSPFSIVNFDLVWFKNFTSARNGISFDLAFIYHSGVKF